MRFDSVHLGYTATPRGIVVHYPHRAATGALTYGSGFLIGDIPPSYWRAPPNPITAERVRIWRELLAAGDADPASPQPVVRDRVEGQE